MNSVLNLNQYQSSWVYVRKLSVTEIYFIMSQRSSGGGGFGSDKKIPILGTTTELSRRKPFGDYCSARPYTPAAEFKVLEGDSKSEFFGSTSSVATSPGRKQSTSPLRPRTAQNSGEINQRITQIAPISSQVTFRNDADVVQGMRRLYATEKYNNPNTQRSTEPILRYFCVKNDNVAPRATLRKKYSSISLQRNYIVLFYVEDGTVEVFRDFITERGK